MPNSALSRIAELRRIELCADEYGDVFLPLEKYSALLDIAEKAIAHVESCGWGERCPHCAELRAAISKWTGGNAT